MKLKIRKFSEIEVGEIFTLSESNDVFLKITFNTFIVQTHTSADTVLSASKLKTMTSIGENYPSAFVNIHTGACFVVDKDADFYVVKCGDMILVGDQFDIEESVTDTKDESNFKKIVNYVDCDDKFNEANIIIKEINNVISKEEN